jgi:hypothetical protein
MNCTNRLNPSKIKKTAPQRVAPARLGGGGNSSSGAPSGLPAFPSFTSAAAKRDPEPAEEESVERIPLQEEILGGRAPDFERDLNQRDR